VKVQDSEKKITTVWLDPDNADNSRIKLFHCFNCRTPVLEYSGKVVSIIPGGAPISPNTQQQCKGKVWHGTQVEKCGIFYTFMGSVFTVDPQYT